MPYSPGVSYHGDAYISQGFRGLGRGIEQAGASMGDAMKERKEEQKRINAGQSVYDKLMGTEDPNYDPSAMSARQKYDAYNAMKEAAQYGMMVQQSEAQRLMNVQREKEMNAPPRPINTAGGLYDPASGMIIPGTGPQRTQLMGARDLNGDGVPDQVAQQNGFYGTWDPKIGDYTGWKPMDHGVDLSAMSPDERRWAILMGKGGQRDYSKVPQYSIESIMGGPGAIVVHAPDADPAQKSSAAPDTADVPPMEGAKKAPDGKWYIQKDGKWFRVER